MKKALLVVLLISGAAIAEEVRTITAVTLPTGYIKKFPLNSASSTDVLAALGPPVRQMEHQGKTLWSYEYGEPGTLGTYTFTIEGDVVTHVQYVNQGGKRVSSD